MSVFTPKKPALVIHDVAKARSFKTDFYEVTYVEIIGSRVGLMKKRMLALQWVEQFDDDAYEWNHKAIFFRHAEHATLFKMGIWLNEL